MKSIVSILFGFGMVLTLNAQTPTDALRLSSYAQGSGTARSMGIGGAIGALGADYSAITVNPAGLASFRSSEIVITPGYTMVKTDALLLNSEKSNSVFSDSKSKFYLNNIGLVGSIRRSSGDWQTHNWSIGFNRSSTFDGSYYFKGDSKGSIMNRFKEKANANPLNLNQFEEALAVEADALTGGPKYVSDFDASKDVAISKSQQGITSGRVNELVFAYAANYKEKIQIGGALGIPFMTYYDNRIYKESDAEGPTELGKVPNFKELVYKENLGVSGKGVNGRLGFIYKPFQALRVGLAAQTPIRYKLSEAYNTSLKYTYGTGWAQTYEEYEHTAFSPDGVPADYIIRTPWRFTGSAAYLLGKKGFLSADVDFIDYSTMAFEYSIQDKDPERDINLNIKNNYVSTANVHVGAEAVLDIFRIRAGLATFGLPVKTTEKNYIKNASKMYTLGLGLRQNHFYLDIAYQFIRTSDEFQPYQVSSDYSSSVADRTQNKSQILVTLVFKF